MSETKVTRVALQQPALPRFRHPPFLALSEQEDLELEVVYESEPGSRNVDPGALNARIEDPLRVNTPAGPLMWAGSQWRLAHKTSCDVLIMTWNTRYLSLVPALLRARRQGVATILWGHGYSKRDSKVRLWLRRAVTRLATAVVFYDARSASDFIDSGGRAVATFIAINAIDQEPIQRARLAWRDPERLQVFRAEQGLEPGPTIAFVSRLNPSRRLDLLVEAVASLRSDYPSLKLIVIGEGAEEQERMERQAGGMGISDAIRFVGPIFDEAELAPWILSADIVAHPSAVGLSVLTAFGFGRAVIANDDPSSNGPEWTAIRHGYNGMYYDAGDPASLGDVLRQVLSDDGLRDRLNRAALRTALEGYALDMMIQGIRRAIDYCRSA